MPDTRLGPHDCHAATVSNFSGYADVNGLSMLYEVQGNGPAVLHLSGGTCSNEISSEDIAALAASFQVIAPEQMGHGRTGDDPDRTFDYHDMAEDTVELMRHLKLESLMIFGFSDGGILGLDIAMHHPELVSKLAVSGTNFSVAGLEETTCEWFRTTTGDEWPQSLHDSYNRLAPDGPGHWNGLIERLKTMWLSQPDYSADQLATITAPNLVIAGDHDAVTPEHTVALFKAIPNARLCVGPSAGHGIVPAETITAFFLEPDPSEA
jgi:pimeloyl-ACP methyl ester carboxylesterase